MNNQHPETTVVMYLGLVIAFAVLVAVGSGLWMVFAVVAQMAAPESTVTQPPPASVRIGVDHYRHPDEPSEAWLLLPLVLMFAGLWWLSRTPAHDKAKKERNRG